MPDTMTENRNDQRFDLCLTARLPAAAANHEVRISNLSESGCYVDSIARVFEGETIVVAILTANSDWVELEGVVAHRLHGLGFGVRFVNLQDAQLRWIHSNIRQSEVSRKEAPASLSLKQSLVICYQRV